MNTKLARVWRAYSAIHHVLTEVSHDLNLSTTPEHQTFAQNAEIVFRVLGEDKELSDGLLDSLEKAAQAIKHTARLHQDSGEAKEEN